MIKRSHVRQFLAVVDAGSFTQAAARIHLTQPTLSAGIAELERLVGARLFVRERRQVRLTEEGGRFLALARGLERDFRRLDEFGRASQSEWPDLRLGMLSSLAAPLFDAVLTALAADYRLELIDGRDADLRGQLATGRIHAALTLLREGEEGPTCHGVLSEPYMMFVPASHPLAVRDVVEPEELASEIMIARRSCEVLETTSRFFTAKGVRPRFAYRSADDTRCMALVAAGQGLTTAPLSHAIGGTVPIRVRGYAFNRRIGLLGDGGWLSQPGMAARFQHMAMRIEEAVRTLPANP